MCKLVVCLAFLGHATNVVAAQTWKSSKAELQYVVVHKFHKVVGKSGEAQAVIKVGDESIQVMARVPVKSFDSGNKNRDAHVLEVVEASKYPLAVLRMVAKGVNLPEVDATSEHTVAAELEFHGVKKKVPVNLTVQRMSREKLAVKFNFSSSLEAHKVERPSLMFVKVDDGMRLSGEFVLEPGS